MIMPVTCTALANKALQQARAKRISADYGIGFAANCLSSWRLVFEFVIWKPAGTGQLAYVCHDATDRDGIGRRVGFTSGRRTR